MTDRILVVDDNPTNLKLAGDVLESAGFVVDRATDAESAQVTIKNSPPQLILMDFQLPRMDGLSLTKILKKDPATQHIPIVALTAYAMKGDEEKALAAGCDGYITKPIDVRRLPLTVADILNSKKK